MTRLDFKSTEHELSIKEVMENVKYILFYFLVFKYDDDLWIECSY